MKRGVRGKAKRATAASRSSRRLAEETAFANYFMDRFDSTYAVNLDTRAYRVCRRTKRLDRAYPVLDDYVESLKAFAARDVHPDDRAAFLRFASPENLRRLMRRNLTVVHTFRSLASGGERFCRLRVVRGADASNVAFAFRDATDEVRRERANEAKSRFFSMVSHDIRTPLNAIIGYAELLKLGIADAAERAKAVDSVLVSGHALLELVNDVLDLSKLEAGKMEIVPEPADARRLTRDVADAFRASVVGRPIEIRTALQPMPWLRFDPHRVRQILFNLVGNAVKFTERGCVEIGAAYARDGSDARSRKGVLRFEVRDTGCGMTAEEQQAIAQPYVQFGDSRIRSKGTGLGLAICRQLVAHMGGEIELESEPGRGTTFRVLIPTVEEEGASRRRRLSVTQRIRCAVGDGQALKFENVLVVDDQAMNLTVLKKMLERLGVKAVTLAENGRDALAKMRANRFDLVLTDIWMPEMDGEELVRRIRRTPAWNGLPVYAITADVEAQKGYVKTGFTGLLLKPVTIENLRSLFVR